MNYLVHAYLSFRKPSYLIGNFLGDFVKNRDLYKIPDEVVEGIMLHRSIDSFTDSHPLILEGTKRLHSKHRKYSGVLLDIYFDYLLASNWKHQTALSLREFIDEAYQIYLGHEEIMPEGIRSRMKAMVADDWLWHYQYYQGLEKTFFYLGKRVSKPEWISGAVLTLKNEEPNLQQLFKDFFPELVSYTESLILQNEARW